MAKRVVISHFFNEAYLLPWWLEHHRQIFDHGVLIDWSSTDGSADICRQLVPGWEVVRLRARAFRGDPVRLRGDEARGALSRRLEDRAQHHRVPRGARPRPHGGHAGAPPADRRAHARRHHGRPTRPTRSPIPRFPSRSRSGAASGRTSSISRHTPSRASPFRPAAAFITATPSAPTRRAGTTRTCPASAPATASSDRSGGMGSAPGPRPSRPASCISRRAGTPSTASTASAPSTRPRRLELEARWSKLRGAAARCLPTPRRRSRLCRRRRAGRSASGRLDAAHSLPRSTWRQSPHGPLALRAQRGLRSRLPPLPGGQPRGRRRPLRAASSPPTRSTTRACAISASSPTGSAITSGPPSSSRRPS